jgi:hypothetical protein
MILCAIAGSPDRKFGRIFGENMRVVRFSDTFRREEDREVFGECA